MRITPAGAVIELRRQKDISWRIFFLQATHRRDRDNPANVQRAQGVDVGPVIDFMRQNPMASPVPRQKIDLPSANLSANECVRRRSERRIDIVFAGFSQFVYLIKTA